MSSGDGQDYLWDRSGSPDPEVQALEQALVGLRHQGEAPSAAERPRRRVWGWLAAAAALVLAIAWGMGDWRSLPEVQLRVDGGGLLREAEWLDAAHDVRIDLDRYGELTVSAGSRLRVDRLDRDVTRLFLQRGELDAFVNLNARPRFFQVGTPAARCVDLGCEYTLTVDEAGVAEVRVTMGQVAFETDDGREVLVLRDAVCRARPDRGAGTPRYAKCPEPLVRALDRFDAAEDPAERLRAARAVLSAAGEAGLAEDALPSWHLMGDRDARVAALAASHVAERFGSPEGIEAGAGRAPTSADLALWKEHLGLGW